MASLKKIVRQATRSVQNVVKVAAPAVAGFATGGVAGGALSALGALSAGKERAPVSEEVIPATAPIVPLPGIPQTSAVPRSEKSDRTSPADPVVFAPGPSEPFPILPLALAAAGLVAVVMLSRKGS